MHVGNNHKGGKIVQDHLIYTLRMFWLRTSLKKKVGQATRSPHSTTYLESNPPPPCTGEKRGYCQLIGQTVLVKSDQFL